MAGRGCRAAPRNRDRSHRALAACDGLPLRPPGSSAAILLITTAGRLAQETLEAPLSHDGELSCAIAYPLSPAAWRASARSAYISIRDMRPSRNVQTCARRISVSGPPCLGFPRWRTKVTA
jgi:hypothetical protein